MTDQGDVVGLAVLSFATGSTGSISETSFDNAGRPIAIALDTAVTFSALQFATGHLARSVLVAPGAWTQSHTWTKLGVPSLNLPYEIDWNTFAMGTTQTVEAGVIFKIIPGSSLSFDNVQLLGTSSEPVVFTVLDDDSRGGDTYGDGPGTPTAGDYSAIQVSGTALIQRTLFRFGEGLEIAGHADVSGSAFEFHSRDALYFYPGSSGSVSSTSFDQNFHPLRLGTDADVSLSTLFISPAQTHRAIFVEGGNWTRNRSWSDFGLPYTWWARGQVPE